MTAHTSWLQKIRCPDCQTHLTITFSQDTFHIATCSCSEYPVIDNILILKKQQYIKKSIKDIRQKKTRTALLRVIELGASAPRRALVKATRVASRITDPFFDRLREIIAPPYINNQPLSKAIAVWKDWGTYNQYRLISHSWNAAVPLLHFIARETKKTDTVIDLGCGWGYSLWYIHNINSTANLFGIDAHFVNLYFAKKYICPQANYICTDANQTLPLATNSVKTAYSSDAFHYVKKQEELVKEMKRVLSPGGLLIVSHIHNKRVNNPGQGFAHTLKEYEKLFGNKSIILSEDKLIKDYAEHNLLDVTRQTASENNKAFAIILTKKKLLAKYKDLLQHVHYPLSINPLWHFTRDGFERKTPQIYLQDTEAPQITTKTFEKIRLSKTTKNIFFKLVQKGILISTPKNFDLYKNFIQEK